MTFTSRIDLQWPTFFVTQEFFGYSESRSSICRGRKQNLRSDELLTGVFESRTRNPVLNQIGLSGRRRVFAAYREALLPFLDGVPKTGRTSCPRLFHLLASAIVGKARVDDGALTDLSLESIGV